MNPEEFPCKAFEESSAWKVIEKAVEELVENGDFLEQTPKRHIVGYLIKQMHDAGMLTTQALEK